VLQLQALTERLHKTNEAIALKIAARDDYDKTVRETESAYMKILESSQTLLTVLKRESVNLTKKKQSSSGTPSIL
jgi:Sjoegren syndrome nuclear autoantigen 1